MFAIIVSFCILIFLKNSFCNNLHIFNENTIFYIFFLLGKKTEKIINKPNERNVNCNINGPAERNLLKLFLFMKYNEIKN